MYQINIKVNADGTITTKEFILRLGIEHEVSRKMLVFDIDLSVEGTYSYVKFAMKKQLIFIEYIVVIHW